MAQDSSQQGPGDYNDALTRLKSRLGSMREANADPYDELGAPSHPLADIARLATLCGRAGVEPVADAMPETIAGPATINVTAEKLGFEVIWETLAPEDLQPGDLPAVVMLRDRSSRLVVGRPQPDQFQLYGAQGGYTVPAKPLSRLATGTVFRIREMVVAEAASPSEKADARPAAAVIAAPAPKASSGAAPAKAPPIGLTEMFAMALKGQKSRLVPLCIASFLINLFGMALPLFSMAVFDRVIPHAAFETLWALALGVTLALALEMLLRHARLKLFDAAGQSASFDLQGRLVSRLLFARAPEVPKAAANVLPVANELDQTALLAPQVLVSIAVDLPFFVLMMLFIASIGGPIVLAPLVGTALLVLVHLVSHHMAKTSHTQHIGENRRQMQQVMDAVAGVERIRLTQSGTHFLSAWESAADKAGYSAHLMRYWHGIAAQAGAMIVQAVIVVTVVAGAFRVREAAMTIGALSAVILLVNRAMMPVSILTGLLFRARQLGEGLGIAKPLLDAPIERAGDRDGTPAAAIAGRIDLARVSFAYPGETKPSLREVSLSIAPGERVGIIGKAGCGKSTLLRLISRLNDPSDGRIAIDQRDIRQYDPADLRRALALMPQETMLFDASLHENLVIGLGPVAKADFERVTRITGVQDFANAHPQGYSLMVGPGGARLSGGERQTVALARALMGCPAMLLLDEPTSAMDNSAEARLIAELQKTAADRNRMGLIIATHRLPVLALVDRVIWLDQGRVVADGPKAQVFAKLGLAA